MKIIITGALFTVSLFPVWTCAEFLPVSGATLAPHEDYRPISTTDGQILTQGTGDQILFKVDRPAIDQLSDALKDAIGAQHPEQKAAIERGEHVEGEITLEGGDTKITCGDFPGNLTVTVREKDGSTHSVDCGNRR